jgi:transcriptional repressor NrdR
VFVVNSRSTKGGSQIWRRRKCEDCEGTFTTYEKTNLSHLKVVKKSGSRQRYSRAKLYSGIYHSSIDRKGADRGIMSELSEELTSQVERRIILLKKKRVHSEEIGDIVLEVLRKRSPDIFLRYLAYREQEDNQKMKGFIKKFYT